MNEWLFAFYKILVWPHPTTFSKIAEEAKGKFQSGIAWLVIAALFEVVLPLIVGNHLNPIVMILTVIALPIQVVLVTALIRYLVQRLTSRANEVYDELFYTFTSIFVVTIGLNTLLVFVPIIKEVINWVIPIYQIGLMVIAVIAITKLKVGPALLIVMVSAVLALIGSILLLLFIPALLQGVRTTF